MSWHLTLEELIAATEGFASAPHPQSGAREFSGVGTDSRQKLKGQVFFALKGESFDAHDFLASAVEAGAAALVVHRLPENNQDLKGKLPIVEVKDTLVAFQLLANYWRHKMRARIIGITGTNGKTTTKEFAARLIGSKLKVQYSKGSLNNHWGVPMSLLSIYTTHEVAIIEMGMNHVGELAELSAIAEPDVVVCTMVGRGHLEGVGSLEGVAKAKAEIYEHAPVGALKIFNLENESTRKMFERMSPMIQPANLLTFASAHFTNKVESTWPRLDVACEVLEVATDKLKIRGDIQGVRGETSVPVFGRQNLNNLMAAACCALGCGLTPAEIWQALPLCSTVWGRNQWVETASGARILFDGYNANPESMRAALENFAGLTPAPGGRKLAVLGEMRELGDHAPELHREIGNVASRSGFTSISFFGPSASEFSTGARSAGFSNNLFISDGYESSLAPQTLPVLNDKDIVLIKGSRGMRLEKVLADLKPIAFTEKT